MNGKEYIFLKDLSVYELINLVDYSTFIKNDEFKVAVTNELEERKAIWFHKEINNVN